MASAAEAQASAPSILQQEEDGRVPNELMGDAPDDSEYRDYRRLADIKHPYRIPPELLVGTKKYIDTKPPEAPLIVFINSKSGGRVGPRLMNVLYRSLGQAQVFDLSENRPGPVLSTIWQNLKRAEEAGDASATYYRSHLRILAAGGDGTVTWVLKTIADLKLDPPPAVAVMPLGTGNDLALSLGWGNYFYGPWIKTSNLYNTLRRFASANTVLMDCWGVEVQAPSEDMLKEGPHSLIRSKDNKGNAKASFWNYFSVGLDAQSAYNFARTRENTPYLAASRMQNQFLYSYYSCTSGWFCGAPSIGNKLRLRVRDGPDAEWRDVALSWNVRAVVLLNLQSYGGGRDVWGLADSSAQGEKFSAPIFDDGLIEVVGFRSGWHTAMVMGGNLLGQHGRRLAQAAEVELSMVAESKKVKGETATAYMQLDGEPWAQEIPAGSFESTEPLRITVKCEGQSKLLFNGDTSGFRGQKRAQKIANYAAKHSTSITPERAAASASAGSKV